MTIVQQLANFSAMVRFDELPQSVVSESKRLLLDSVGCAFAALDSTKGQVAIKYAKLMGGCGPATIMGTSERASPVAAAFANAELINALDMDSILPPGHVTPYVIPGALAIAETLGTNGKTLIEAIAVAHEMSHRFGLAMDNLRDTEEGKRSVPQVFGYSSTVFGAAAAVGKVKNYSEEVLAHALAIAACLSPVNYQISWFKHPPVATIKYAVGGAIVQQAMAAAHLAEFGHSGDAYVIDDGEWGYRRFIGSRKWEPVHLTNGLGEEWLFPAVTSYKPYAHCRVMHSSIECLTRLMIEQKIKTEDIESIKVYIEGFAEQPIWLNRQITHLNDAQFSTAHSMAMAAHRPPTARAWQDPELVFSKSVMELMSKVQAEVHPDYAKLLAKNGASRPAHVEIRARGQTFTAQQQFPKGTPSPDPKTFMENADLQNKFRDNARGVISDSTANRVIDVIMGLETLGDVSKLMHLLTRESP